MPTHRNYLQRDVKLLWGLAAARCSRCRVEVVAEATAHDREAVLGEIAHIADHSGQGSRSDPALTRDERRRYPNLILLCARCHTLVDGQSNTFTTADLRRWKADHETWVRRELAEELPAVSFAELEVATAALLNAPLCPTVELTLTRPEDKMRKNDLTSAVLFDIQQGMVKSPEVGRFLVEMSKLDPEFPERLCAGFLSEYRRLRGEGVTGDALFFGLLSFASSGAHTFRRQAAGLAVLVHLFEICEIFER